MVKEIKNQDMKTKLPLVAKIIGWVWVFLILFLFSSVGEYYMLAPFFIMIYSVSLVFSFLFLIRYVSGRSMLISVSFLFLLYGLWMATLEFSLNVPNGYFSKALLSLFLIIFSLFSFCYLMLNKEVKEVFNR